MLNWLLSWFGLEVAPLGSSYHQDQQLAAVLQMNEDVVRENATLSSSLKHYEQMKEFAKSARQRVDAANRDRDLHKLEADYVKSRLEEQSALRVKLARYEAQEARIESDVRYQPWLDDDFKIVTIQ